MEQFQELFDGCLRNDRKSQEKLYAMYYPAMYTLCRKFFSDDHEIQTALNNGLMKVFKNLNRYDSQKGEFFNWMYTIVRHACLTILRDKKPETTKELKENMSDLYQYDPFKESDWEDIFDNLAKLPPATRAVCSLFYLEGFNIREIENATGIKEGTVKWHLNESRNRLRAIFIKSKEV